MRGGSWCPSVWKLEIVFPGSTLVRPFTLGLPSKAFHASTAPLPRWLGTLFNESTSTIKTILFTHSRDDYFWCFYNYQCFAIPPDVSPLSLSFTMSHFRVNVFAMEWWKRIETVHEGYRFRWCNCLPWIVECVHEHQSDCDHISITVFKYWYERY